ncbi:MAG: hypothetical protein H0T92_09890 [Pyrinomonadaceae bacterium]|nr:hypothetical protein [Pyrinomonadaceae bacterium]
MLMALARARREQRLVFAAFFSSETAEMAKSRASSQWWSRAVNQSVAQCLAG